jgi:hypothetical protein
MVKKIFFFLSYTLFFFGALIYFSPKEQLYYLGEEYLKQESVFIYNESLQDEGFSFTISEFDLALQGVKSLHAKEAKITLFGFYNSIGITDIELSSALASFIPLKITNVKLGYTLLNPLEVSIELFGDFGEAYGGYSLIDNEVEIKVIASEQMKREFKHTLKEFKKDDKGEYSYAKKF